MQQAGCKLEEDIRTEIIMRCYVEARQPDMVLATLQDFIDGGGQVSGSGICADAEQVGLVGSRADRLLPGMCTPAVPEQPIQLGSAAKHVHTQLLRPAFPLFAPALAITALALLAMCRACICLRGAHSLDSTCLSLTQALPIMMRPALSSCIELRRECAPGIVPCTGLAILPGQPLSCCCICRLSLQSRRAAFELLSALAGVPCSHQPHSQCLC